MLDPQRVAELFDAAAELDESAATLFLREQCAGDDALHAAVRRLLVADRAAGETFLVPNLTILGDAARAHSDPIPEVSRIGRFVLLRKLGEGGMGVVYAALDETLDRKVAIKLLHRAQKTQDWLEREARALARLSHPNVVQVYSVGEHEGRGFVEMELVNGETLRDFLGAAPSTESILGAYLQAGRGLCAAHEAGVVHRDFKPDNALRGADGRVHVVDFGIAALASGEPHGAARVGTPSFMAPEQLRGESANAASDQFAFCVALHEALFGQPPFEGDDVEARMQSVLAGRLRPPPASTKVPHPVREAIARGLALDPRDRYATLEELLAELTPFCGDTAPDRAHRTRREQRLIGIVLLVAGFAIAIYAFVRRPSTTSTAELAQIAAGLLVVSVSVVALVWKRVGADPYGRKLAVALLTQPVFLLAHRLLALRLGTAAPDVLTIDMLEMAVASFTLAIAFDRRFALGALAPSLGVVAAAVRPDLALPAMILVFPLSLILVLLLREREKV